MENYQLNPLLFLSENVIPGISNKLARRISLDNIADKVRRSNAIKAFTKADHMKRMGSYGARDLGISRMAGLASGVNKKLLGDSKNAKYLKNISGQAKKNAEGYIGRGKMTAKLSGISPHDKIRMKQQLEKISSSSKLLKKIPVDKARMRQNMVSSQFSKSL